MDIPHVTCTLCGCLCDDLVVRTDGVRILETWRACVPARQWYLRQTVQRTGPDATIDGRPATLDEGLTAAAQLLAEARYPLVYGMGRATCEAQRQAVQLAEQLGGVIDTHTSLAHGSTKLAGQLVGKVTCTLGEIRNRADLVVFWLANPLVSHPRHATRYSVFPPGRYLPNQGRGRSVVVVDVDEDRRVSLADQHLRIRKDCDFELITALRVLVRGGDVAWQLLDECGVAEHEVRELAERIRRARFGVFFFGNGLTRTRGTHMNVAAILSLARELNEGQRFTAIPLRNLANEAGSDNVLSWLAGYPFSVDYSRGYPRYNPGEFSVVDLLRRGDNDAALVIAADPATSLPVESVDHLRRMPVVLLDPEVTATSALARVQFFTGQTGISVGGTAYRMDKVPISIRAPLRSTAPSDEQVLVALNERIAELAGPA